MYQFQTKNDHINPEIKDPTESRSVKGYRKQSHLTVKHSFTLTESSNKQNNTNLADFPPLKGIERPLNANIILVWRGMSPQRVYGPYYFETSVNQHNYLDYGVI